MMVRTQWPEGFPFKPGDELYWLSEGSDAITKEVAHSIGFNEDGSVFVREDFDFTLGAQSWCFLTEEDARRYQEDPEHFPKDYCHVNPKELDLPFYPGTKIYVCDNGNLDGSYDIFEDYYTYVILWDNGRVEMGDGETQLALDNPKWFMTYEEAWKYVRKSGRRFRRFYPKED